MYIYKLERQFILKRSKKYQVSKENIQHGSLVLKFFISLMGMITMNVTPGGSRYMGVLFRFISTFFVNLSFCFQQEA